MVKINCIDLSKGCVSDRTFSFDKNASFDVVRKDIISHVIRWQLLKRREVSHSIKLMSDVKATTKKPFRQKGLGRARQGSMVSPHFRGGGCVFGPIRRDFVIKVNKKIKKSAMTYAINSKVINKQLFCFEGIFDFAAKDISTNDIYSLFAGSIEEFNKSRVLVIVKSYSSAFALKAKNIKNIKLLIEEGLNVYDIINSRYVFLEEGVFEYIHERYYS